VTENKMSSQHRNEYCHYQEDSILSGGFPVGEPNSFVVVESGGHHYSSGDILPPLEFNGHPQQQLPHGEESAFDDIPDILLLNHYCSHGKFLCGKLCTNILVAWLSEECIALIAFTPSLLCYPPASPPQDDTEEARIAADQSWEPVRNWMLNHDVDQVRAASEQRDDAGKTALHFACQNTPPKDIIDVFLSVAVDIVQWPDSFGWLPIHYACAYGADTVVIQSLADAFPESKTKEDRKGRTPLHFALGTSNSNSPAVVVLLSSTGAASYADDNGMLVRLLRNACIGV
jgi:ankyrin repeat protein